LYNLIILKKGKALDMQKQGDQRLAIGLGKELFVQVIGMEERFNAFLIGMEPPKYLIIHMQTPSKLWKSLDKGSQLVVRYLHSGNIYGFQTKLIGSITNPFRLIFLSYPEEIEAHNLRNTERISSYIPATAVVNDEEVRGIITDLSTGGARFTIATGAASLQGKVNIGEDITVSFPLLGIEGMQRCRGKIKRLDGDMEKISFGIQFIGVDSIIESKIDAYVKDVLEYQDLSLES
jgi:c-di-GMP-binding flagellar brake protein YcgR